MDRLSHLAMGLVIHNLGVTAQVMSPLMFLVPILRLCLSIALYAVTMGVLALLASNCTMNFADSGFILDVPNSYANKPVVASLTAVRKDNVTEKCTPTFASVTKSVNFWSDYLSPALSQVNNAAQARINTTDIATSEASPTAIVLNFDEQGTANFTLNYSEAGSLN